MDRALVTPFPLQLVWHSNAAAGVPGGGGGVPTRVFFFQDLGEGVSFWAPKIIRRFASKIEASPPPRGTPRPNAHPSPRRGRSRPTNPPGNKTLKLSGTNPAAPCTGSEETPPRHKGPEGPPVPTQHEGGWARDWSSNRLAVTQRTARHLRAWNGG